MQNYFVKSKFNLLNTGLYNYIYKKEPNYNKNDNENIFEKKNENNDKRRIYLNRELNGAADKHETAIKRVKGDYRDQLFYSYYNNLNRMDEEIVKEKKNDLKNIYEYNNNNSNNKSSKDILNYINEKQNDSVCIKNNQLKEGILYDEFKKLKNDVLVLQVMNVNLQKQLLSNHIINSSNVMPQHIIINNKTEVASNAINQIQDNKKNKSFLQQFLKKILSSRFNQMLFVSSLFVSFYLINQHWKRALKVSQLEKKINSNVLLKTVKLLEETLGVRKFG